MIDAKADFTNCLASITVEQLTEAALFAWGSGVVLEELGGMLPKALQGLTAVGTAEQGFANGFMPAQVGNLEEAAAAQARAQELNSMRRAWESRNGTTAVANVLNMNTGEAQTWIATESGSVPSTWNGALQQNEVYIPGAGHAEQTIVNALGDEWQVTSGGTSRNICIGTCQPLLEGQGLTLGGPDFPGMSDKTPYRMFWSER